MTKPACDSMSNHRRPDSLAYDEPETRAPDTHHELGPVALESMNDQISPSLTTSPADSVREIRATPQSIRLR